MLIGVFHPQDPFAVMPKERVEAILAEAARQEVRLVFFNESGIDLEQQTVQGLTSRGSGEWQEAVFPFPTAVMNIRPWGPRKRTPKELVFRKMVPFTAFLIGDKWEVTRLLSGSAELSGHLVPTLLLKQVETIEELLLEHDKLVLKPASGSRGDGVQALTRSGDVFVLQNGTSRKEMSREELTHYIAGFKKDFLIQPYIRCLTSGGEPFDFRILVQRNGAGEWTVPLIYPRIGQADTITSNVSIGGRTELLEAFLARELPAGRYSLPKQLHDLGLAIAEAVNSHYAFPLNELGIDLAVDNQCRIWFYEANTCPGTLNHEAERAVLAIAYAKYVGTENLKTREAPLRQESGRVTAGLLFDAPPALTELEPYAGVAASLGMTLSYFLYEDIRFRASTIAAHVQEGQEWVRRNIPFPDVVYNLIQQDHKEDVSRLHSSTHHLFLTSTEPKGPIPSSLFMALASREPRLLERVPAYMSPDEAEEARLFIDRHGSVVMKSGGLSEEEETLFIKRLPTQYEVRDSEFIHHFNTADFAVFLGLFQEAGYVLIQQIDSRISGGHPLHLRVYLMKDQQNVWRLMQITPLLALAPLEQPDNPPVIVDWDWLLFREFGDASGEDMDLLIQELAVQTAQVVEASNHRRFHELVVDFALDKDRKLWLLGAEFDGPQDVVHPYDVARIVLPYAKSRIQNPS